MKNEKINNIKKIYFCVLVLFICIFISGCSIVNQINCEHVWEETVETEATCINNGVLLKTCTICGKKMHERISATGHEYEVISEVSATCEKDGAITKKCKYCGDGQIETIYAIGHDIKSSENVNPTCTTNGYKKGVCTRCGKEITEEIEATGHNWSNWEVTQAATSDETGLETRTCSVCGATETNIIPIVDYIDLDVIKYAYAKKDLYEISSEDELALLYSSAILNRCDTIVINLNFTYDNFQDMFTRVKEKQSIEATYSSTASLKESTLTINFTYADLPFKTTTSDNRYEQYASLNEYKNTKTRSDTYDDFKINSKELSYEVSTSDQLVYVLERGVKPIVTENSSASVLYNKAKQILRDIINDNMTDIEKVRAIHDWLIMNVTYDNALYELLYAGASDLKSYNGFYLEGVFNDGYAVCEGISDAFVVLANIEGIPCVKVTGISNLNPNGAGHAWNKIKVDNKWYVIDATSDGTIVSDTFEILSYEYFLISDNTMANSKNQYIGTNHTAISCVSDYNAYANFTYDGTHSFNVNSFDELKALVKIFNNMSDANKTVQFKFNYEYTNASDEVSKAFSVNHITSTFSYIDSNGIFTIIESK